MGTEDVSPRYQDLDLWDDATALDALLEAQMAAVAAVRPALPALRQAVAAAVPRLKAGGRIVYAGAGTSGRLAAQDAAELSPTFSWPQDRALCLLAGGTDALVRSVEGAEDDADAARAAVAEANVGPNDVLVALAASGKTPYAVAVVEEARARGALTVGVANNPDRPLLAAAEIAVTLDTGPEPVAGSTRMKAGTAQKIVLNLFSTLLMVRLGRVYRGLMVDVIAGNAKLRVRSRDMLIRLAGGEPEEAERALAAAGGNVKLAALIRRGLSPEAGRAALERCGGDLRRALAALPAEAAR